MLSYEAGPLRNPAHARSILENVVREVPFKRALHELAVILERGDVGVAVDTERAAMLHARAKLEGTYDFGNTSLSLRSRTIMNPGDQFGTVVEGTIRTALFKPQHCFLITLGGGDRGKTSVVRSLRGMSFEKEHIPTELVSLDQLRIWRGERLFSEQEIEECRFSDEYLTANASRINTVARGVMTTSR